MKGAAARTTRFGSGAQGVWYFTRPRIRGGAKKLLPLIVRFLTETEEWNAL
jgi:hypothetical protein